MQKLIRSRFLSVKKKETKYHITKLTTMRCIVSHEDLVDLIDYFHSPISPLKLQDGYDREEFFFTITKLKEIGILVPVENEEEQDILLEWQRRLPDLSLITPPDSDSPFIIYSGNSYSVHAAWFIKVTTPIYRQTGLQLFPFRRKVYTLFLSDSQYQKISEEYHIPGRTMAFVDSKSILIIKADHLMEWLCDARKYFYSIKHELIHILLGQRHHYIPAWIEEGICELYSGQKTLRLVEEILKKHKKIYKFTEAESLITCSIMDIDDSPVTRNSIYAQAFSFVKYLIDTIGEKQFWNVIKNTGIRINFKEIFYKITKRTIVDMEDEWAGWIRSVDLRQN